MHATNPFTPPNRQAAPDWRWRRPIRLGCSLVIIVLTLLIVGELSAMQGYCHFKFTVILESGNYERPRRVFLLSDHRSLDDPYLYREPWGDRQAYGDFMDYAYVDSFQGEPILLEIHGSSYETWFRISYSYLPWVTILAEWPDGTKTIQVVKLPDYATSKTAHVRLVR
jgi:hypothetical protein